MGRTCMVGTCKREYYPDCAISFHRCPENVNFAIHGHEEWLKVLRSAEDLVKADADFQEKVAKGLVLLKGRRLAPEVVGRMYSQYCVLINKLYDVYLTNVQIQKAPYIVEIISVFIKRLYELRNELVHILVTEYIYVDGALTQLHMTPDDIQIIVPYHLTLDSRPNSAEELFQNMMAESIKRLKTPPKKPKPVSSTPVSIAAFDEAEEDFPASVAPSSVAVVLEDEEEEIVSEKSVHTIIPEKFIHALVIQRHERYRRFYLVDHSQKRDARLKYFAAGIKPARKRIRAKAAALIVTVYREYMQTKRQRVLDIKRDVILGIIPETERKPMNLTEERNKLYDFHRKVREKIQQPYTQDFDRVNTRLLRITKGNQIDDITEQIREWFREWYYGYGFFPQYPYEAEGGTILVINGQYPTTEEQQEDDENYIRRTKGKTKETLEQEKKQKKIDAEIKKILDAEREKKEKLALFKARCNPPSDPGYQPKLSENTENLIAVLRKYQQAWSIYDQFPLQRCKEVIYGYMIPVLNDEIMHEMHLECRKYVDQLMRLELKLFVKAQQAMFSRVDWKYPKLRTRKRPKPIRIPKPFVIDDNMLKNIEKIFDLGIMSRPKTKIADIFGDLNYIAYDMITDDPDATFPSPGYGDIRRRLVLTCIFGSGLEPSANRNKTVMLLGQPRNGKSFLVDACAGEMNAIKFDISPEVFSSKTRRPAKLLNYVFQAARIFQPAVIYFRDIERVFAKKLTPNDKRLKCRAVKRPIGKLLKTIPVDEKIIFIATCSDPFVAKARPLVRLFNEIILVPRPEYATVQCFVYKQLLKMRSIPKDINVHSFAILMEGYGFGIIIELLNKILSAERIVRLNVTPLSPVEILEYLIENKMEKLTVAEYEKYMNFVVNNSFLKRERAEYALINASRKMVYDKLRLKKEKAEAQAAEAQAAKAGKAKK